MFQHDLLQRFDLQRQDTARGRYYRTPDGAEYPSVTTVLGKFADRTWLERWRKAVGEENADRISKNAADQGTRMHSMMETYLGNEDPNAGAASVDRMQFAHIRKLLDAHVGRVRGLELRVWSHHLRAAGTADIVAEWDLHPSIVDLKNLWSQREKNPEEVHGHFLQAACYAMMVFERYDVACRWAVIIAGNGLEAPTVYRRPVENYMSEVYDIFTRERW